MDGTQTIVKAVKKSMNLAESRGSTYGISSQDISKFLRDLVKQYKAIGRNVIFKWKKLEGSRDGRNNGFSGKHVERIVRHKEGKFILFGKAARANVLRALTIRKLKKETSQKKKFEVYGTTTQGQP